MKTEMELLRTKLQNEDRKKKYGIIMKSIIESDLEKILRLRGKPKEKQ